MSTSSGEYLTKTGNAVIVQGQAVLTAAAASGWSEFILQQGGFPTTTRLLSGSSYVAWSSVVAGPSLSLVADAQDTDPTIHWIFEQMPQRSCTPGGPVTMDPNFVYERSHLRTDGCFLIETNPVPGFGLRYVIPTHGSGGSYILTTDRNDALRRGKFVVLKLTHTRAAPADPANDTSFSVIFNDADFNDLNFPGAGPREMMFAGQSSYYNNPGGVDGVKHYVPVDTLEPPFAESLRYRWNIRPGPRGSAYENTFFFQNSLPVNDGAGSVYPWLSWRTSPWLGQGRLVTLPDIGTGEAGFLLEPVTCTGPSAATTLGVQAFAEYLSSVRSLPNDAINPRLAECIEQPCIEDMHVVILGGTYVPLNAGNLIMGRATGIGYGDGSYRYLDEVDRCAVAHDKGYWTYGLRGNEAGLMACFRHVEPKTQQEARHKLFALNNLLTSGNPTPIGDQDYLQLPADLTLVPINTGVDSWKPLPGDNTHPCTGILDPSRPHGWRPHPLCTPTQIEATGSGLKMRIPRVPGDANRDGSLDRTDKDLIRHGFGSIGLIYDPRDTNQDRTIDESDIIRNTRPTANAGPLTLTVDQSLPTGAVVTLDGSASSDADLDPLSDFLSYVWTWPGGSATGVSPTVTLPLGTTRVTLTVDDGYLSTFPTDVIDVTVRDLTPPTLTRALSSQPNANGWHRTAVTVTFTCADFGGVAVPPVASRIFTAEGAGQTFTASCTDTAGLQTSLPVTVNIDMTAPTITGAASPAANAAGWYHADVTVSFTCTDALSGVDSCAPARTVSTEGTGQTCDGTVVDLAGNTASATVSGINLDKTAPAIVASRAPVANPTGWDVGDVTVSFTCSDTLSGIASCPLPAMVSTGGPHQSRSGSAVDLAGNTANAAVGGINLDKTPAGDPLVLRLAAVSGAPGGTVQARLELTQPRPIGGGSAIVSLGALTALTDLAIHGTFGDAAAAAVVRGSTLRLRTVSPSSGIGASTDLPIVTATVSVPTGAPVGTTNPLSILGAAFTAPSGALYAANLQDGLATISAASIADVSPGGALVPSGGTITITGSGVRSRNHCDREGLLRVERAGRRRQPARRDPGAGPDDARTAGDGHHSLDGTAARARRFPADGLARAGDASAPWRDGSGVPPPVLAAGDPALRAHVVGDLWLRPAERRGDPNPDHADPRDGNRAGRSVRRPVPAGGTGVPVAAGGFRHGVHGRLCAATDVFDADPVHGSIGGSGRGCRLAGAADAGRDHGAWRGHHDQRRHLPCRRSAGRDGSLYAGTDPGCGGCVSRAAVPDGSAVLVDVERARARNPAVCHATVRRDRIHHGAPSSIGPGRRAARNVSVAVGVGVSGHAERSDADRYGGVRGPAVIRQPNAPGLAACSGLDGRVLAAREAESLHANDVVVEGPDGSADVCCEGRDEEA